MKKRLNIAFAAALLGSSMLVQPLMAGNPERQGQAGAAQLTINGWARSSALGWAGAAGVTGLEATFMNVAGMDKMASLTELAFSRTAWLVGSGISVNNVGFAQKLADGDGGTLGFTVMQFGVDPIDITTTENPYGGIGTYRVNMTNIGVSYSKSFSNAIAAGFTMRMVNEGIPDASASGVVVDAGVQYSTTLRPTANAIKRNDFNFGVSIKNIGPDMMHKGDGLSYKALLQNGTFDKTVQVKVDPIKMPSLLNISATYDIRLDKVANMYDNKLTLGFGFTNYAFSANQTVLGAEYTYKDFLSLRGAFVYQEGVFSEETRTSAFTGASAGLSYNWTMDGGNIVSLDYSYRHTNPFDGVHSFGVRIGLGAAE